VVLVVGEGAWAGWCSCLWWDLPDSSPPGAPTPAAEGDDELDMAATASSLPPASLDTVIVLVAGCEVFRAAGRLCACETRAAGSGAR